MSGLVVLSHFQARPLLLARADDAASVQTSLDLGLTQTSVKLTAAGVALPDGQALAWDLVTTIASNEGACYHVAESRLHKIQRFSETFNRAYTLFPTAAAPMLLISGLPMHRIKGTDPQQDTQAKLAAARPSGRVLDTAMGLGYTAIGAAQRAASVLTVELDPAVVDICRLNPWSQGLFSADNIERRIGDSFDVIETRDDGEFSCIIHDPPTFSLAGHLYSLDFYRELYRVLAHRGRLFHYIGDLKSRSGAGVARGVRQRLRQAGFARIADKKRAFGVVAYK